MAPQYPFYQCFRPCCYIMLNNNINIKYQWGGMGQNLKIAFFYISLTHKILKNFRIFKKNTLFDPKNTLFGDFHQVACRRGVV